MDHAVAQPPSMTTDGNLGGEGNRYGESARV